jgi:hypothetical protein
MKTVGQAKILPHFSFDENRFNKLYAVPTLYLSPNISQSL